MLKRQQPEQIAAEDPQWVFNVSRKSCIRKWASAGPYLKLGTRSEKMDVLLNSEPINELKLKKAYKLTKSKLRQQLKATG